MPEEDTEPTDARSEEVIADRARRRVLAALRDATDIKSATALSRKARGNKKENSTSSGSSSMRAPSSRLLVSFESPSTENEGGNHERFRRF